MLHGLGSYCSDLTNGGTSQIWVNTIQISDHHGHPVVISCVSVIVTRRRGLKHRGLHLWLVPELVDLLDAAGFGVLDSLPLEVVPLLVGKHPGEHLVRHAEHVERGYPAMGGQAGFYSGDTPAGDMHCVLVLP